MTNIRNYIKAHRIQFYLTAAIIGAGIAFFATYPTVWILRQEANALALPNFEKTYDKHDSLFALEFNPFTGRYLINTEMITQSYSYKDKDQDYNLSFYTALSQQTLKNGWHVTSYPDQGPMVNGGTIFAQKGNMKLFAGVTGDIPLSLRVEVSNASLLKSTLYVLIGGIIGFAIAYVLTYRVYRKRV